MQKIRPQAISTQLIRTIGVGCVALAVLVGCSGGKDDASAPRGSTAPASSGANQSATPSESGSAPASASPTSFPKSARPSLTGEEAKKVEKYADSVHTWSKPVRTSMRDLETCQSKPKPEKACAEAVKALKQNNKTLNTKLSNASKEGTEDYVGPTPKELQKLVPETVDVTRELDEVLEKMRAECTDGECEHMEAPFEKVMLKYATALGQWEQYTGE